MSIRVRQHTVTNVPWLASIRGGSNDAEVNIETARWPPADVPEGLLRYIWAR